MKKGVETSGKIGGYVTGVGEFENEVQKSLGPRKRAPKNSENLFFEKNIGKFVCVAKRRWCCRVDWYIWLRNVGKMELRFVRHLELE